MKVKRIVPNIKVSDREEAALFYEHILELTKQMDHGWIVTYGSNQSTSVQISFATDGGSGTPVPDLSIEVDDVAEVYSRMQKNGFPILYELTDESWGVRRFYVRDPFGKIVNILSHR